VTFNDDRARKDGPAGREMFLSHEAIENTLCTFTVLARDDVVELRLVQAHGNLFSPSGGLDADSVDIPSVENRAVD